VRDLHGSPTVPVTMAIAITNAIAGVVDLRAMIARMVLF
jgi:hypothetical protein